MTKDELLTQLYAVIDIIRKSEDVIVDTCKVDETELDNGYEALGIKAIFNFKRRSREWQNAINTRSSNDMPRM